MRLDNTRLITWQFCPFKYDERFVVGIEPDTVMEARDFGKRGHQLLEEHYRRLRGDPREPYPDFPDAAIELEAQAVYAAYQQHYITEPFDVIDVERTVEVPLPDIFCPRCGNQDFVRDFDDTRHFCPCDYFWPKHRHSYLFKMDVVGRDKAGGFLEILDHKFEKRSSLRNLPDAWAARTQASLYLWAAPQIYGEPVNRLLINRIRRPSEKWVCGPEFPERDILYRSPEQISAALKNLAWVADQIERAEQTGFWPEFRENCKQGNFKCDFYDLHNIGKTEANLKKFRKAEEYLDL